MGFDIVKAAQRQLSQMSGQSFKDQFVPMPEGKTGVVLIRILPSAIEGDLPWVVTRIHRNINDRYYHCPREQSPDGFWRGQCPICEYYSFIWSQVDGCKDEDEKKALIEMGRAIKPRIRAYYNAIVRKMTDSRGESVEDVGPRILSNGEKLYLKILNSICGDDTDEPLGDVTDFETGRDFRIVKKTTAGSGNFTYPSYDTSNFLNPSPTGSKEQIKQWMANLHDLKKLRVIKTTEELRHQVDIMQGLVPDDAVEVKSAFQIPGKQSKGIDADYPMQSPARQAPPVKQTANQIFAKPKKYVEDDDQEIFQQVSKAASQPVEASMDDDLDIGAVGDDFLDDIHKILNKRD